MNPNDPNDPSNSTPVNEPLPEPTPLSDVAPSSEFPAETPAPEQPVEAPTIPEPFEAPAAETPATNTPVVETSVPSETPSVDTPPAGAVFAASSVSTPAPQAPNKKKLFVLAGIIGGVILLAVVGVVAYLLLTTVSREDYTAAVKQFNEVSRASTQLESKALSLSGSAFRGDTDEEFAESLAELKEAVTSLKTENDELSQLKAVRVGEGAEYYTAFSDKLKAYLDYAEGLVGSIEVVRPAIAACNEISDTSASDAAARVAAIRACATELGDTKDVPNENYKTYISTLSKSYTSLADITEKVAALTAPYGAQYEEYKALRDQLRDVQDDISDASTKFRESSNDSRDKYNPKEDANALGSFLQEKQKA
ncbi:MAG: hypothetical protein ACREGE_03250 [Candidatus Microsaccharimonas sp.]